MLHTTLNKLRKSEACADGYKKVLDYVGLDYGKDAPIALIDILKSNNLSDTLWVLDNDATLEPCKIFRMRFGAWCAQQVLPIFEAEYPSDRRVRDCIDKVLAYCDGTATEEEVKVSSAAAYAARTGASAASAASASANASANASAAYAAAYAAGTATASAASAAYYASCRASSASYDDFLSLQESHLIKMLEA